MGFSVVSGRLRRKLVLIAEVGGGSMGIPYATLMCVCVCICKALVRPRGERNT